MDPITEMAKLFRDRDNPNNFEITTAVLINKSPITLKLGQRIFLNSQYQNLVMTRTVHDKIQEVDTPLGLEVIVIPISDGSMWYAIDEAVR